MLKKFIKNLTPPIFLKLFYFIFSEDEFKYFEFEKSNQNRISLINRAIANKNVANCMYLEIGVFRNKVFNSIPLPIENKIGVDPEMGGTHRMTSDQFFDKNTDKFDVIFIDGLHHYEQVQKDLINSIKSLKENGIILIHDMLPQNAGQEKVPQSQKSWTGDVWKVGVELLESKIDFVVANFDHGVGIVKPKTNSQYKKLNSKLLNKRFEYFIEVYKNFSIVDHKDAFKFIDS